MNVHEQRDFVVKAAPILDEAGRPLTYTQAVSDFQDWFFPQIQLKVSEDEFKSLDRTTLEVLIQDHPAGGLTAMNRIYIGGLVELLTDFFPSGAESQASSKAPVEDGLDDTPPKITLSTTLKQSPPT